MPKELVLAGDIGGTKTNLALFSVRDDKLHSEAVKTYPSQQYSGLGPIVQEFLAGENPGVGTACFGIAGAVLNGRVKTPNLPWALDARELRELLQLQSLTLLNDLEAGAYGIFTLNSNEFCILNEGREHASGGKALIAAGTGLGQAMLHDEGRYFRPLASEGGHADFAPRNDLEIQLLRYLMSRFGHVSYERVLSGPGFFNIYSFLRDERIVPEPQWLAEQIAASSDVSATVAQFALAGQAEICVKTLDLFVSIYGAEAGNLALRGKATRGLYVGGGIAPKILEKIKDGTFMRAFVDKGRYTDFLSAVPVLVVLNDRAALRGAAYYAAFLSDD